MRSYWQFEEQAAFRARRATVLRDRGLLPESSRTRGARRATVLRDRGLLPESSRTRGARWATVLRHRGLLPPKDLEVEVASPSCRELPQGPQGTTALSTPLFVRAGYDCRNNTTVLRRPEAVGWAPLVCAGPLTTSLRGLWVSGLLPPGNGGTNEGAATQKPTVRHKGAATQKNRPAKGGTLEATWVRGEGTREPWRRGATDFLQVVAATACPTVNCHLGDGRWTSTLGYGGFTVQSSTARSIMILWPLMLFSGHSREYGGVTSSQFSVPRNLIG